MSRKMTPKELMDFESMLMELDSDSADYLDSYLYIGHLPKTIFSLNDGSCLLLLKTKAYNR